MTWVKLDDQFPDHPTVVSAGPLASWLYVCGLTYCARQMTDGFIPYAIVRRLADIDEPYQHAIRLVSVGLWHEEDDGFSVHDYCEHQTTKADIEAKRRAGKAGGKATAKARATAPARRLLQQSAKHVLNDSSSYTETEEEIETEKGIRVAPKTTRVRKRDPLFEAIAEAWKGQPYHADLLTPDQSALVGKCSAAIAKVRGSPEDVPGEWALLRERFDNPTPAALAKHWGTNGTGLKHDNGRKPRGAATVDAAAKLIEHYEQLDRAGDGTLAINDGSFRTVGE